MARVESCPVATLTILLVLGSCLSQGCAVGAALGLIGATTTAGVLVSDACNRSPNEEEPWFVSAFAENETELYSGPGEEYSHVGTLKEGAEIRLLGQRGDWVECCCDSFGHGWVHHSSVSGR
jgi:SH3-like domain-containing protein